MSKFQELSKVFIASREAFSCYKEDCRTLAAELYKQFIAYLEVDPSNVQLVSINENGAYEATVPMSNALVLTEGGYWYFGIGLSFGASVELYQNELTVFHIMLKKETNGNFTLRLGIDGQKFAIDTTQSECFKDFFDYIYQETLQDFQDETVFANSEGGEHKRIGFKLSS